MRMSSTFLLRRAARQLAYRFSKVTSREVMRLDLAQRRLRFANLLHERAPCAKPAARRKIQRARHRSRDNCKLFLPFAQRGERAKQPVGIRMLRALEEQR